MLKVNKNDMFAKNMSGRELYLSWQKLKAQLVLFYKQRRQLQSYLQQKPLVWKPWQTIKTVFY